MDAFRTAWHMIKVQCIIAIVFIGMILEAKHLCSNPDTAP